MLEIPTHQWNEHILQLLADGKWHNCVHLAGVLRKYVSAQKAVRRYHQWYRSEKASKKSLNDRVRLGKLLVCRDHLCRLADIEHDSKPGEHRMYRLRQGSNGQSNEKEDNAQTTKEDTRLGNTEGKCDQVSGGLVSPD